MNFSHAELHLFPKNLLILKKGFTLAEVLITLGIIAVVAALTLASMIQKYQEKVIVTQLKKQTNIMRQAIISAVEEYGTPDIWFNSDMTTQEATEIFVKNVKPYLNVTRTCNSAYPGSASDKYCAYENSPFKGYISLFLADGTVWYVSVNNPSCYYQWYYPYKLCAADGGGLVVDLNGKRGKNKSGYDIFNFYLTSDSSLGQYLWPEGNKHITNGNQAQFPRDCRWDNPSSRLGKGCTAWVLINENMDYLHCPEKLGWNKARSCKDN